MSSQEYFCGKCGGTMVKGFAADRSEQYHLKLGWVDGEPEHASFLGLKGDNVRVNDGSRRDVLGLRCEKCGFLELYAV
ncbi:MAG: hypothetical protein QM785_17510 [Pyrinomonadaceae bacterium]